MSSPVARIAVVLPCPNEAVSIANFGVAAALLAMFALVLMNDPDTCLAPRSPTATLASGQMIVSAPSLLAVQMLAPCGPSRCEFRALACLRHPAVV